MAYGRLGSRLVRGLHVWKVDRVRRVFKRESECAWRC